MHAYIHIYTHILCSCFSTDLSERAPGNAPVDAKVMKAAGWKNAVSEFVFNFAKAILVLKYCNAVLLSMWLLSQHLTAADI